MTQRFPALAWGGDAERLSAKSLPAAVPSGKVAMLAKAGTKLGAAKMVGGSFGLPGASWVLNLSAVDVASGKAEQAPTKSIIGNGDGMLLAPKGMKKLYGEDNEDSIARHPISHATADPQCAGDNVRFRRGHGVGKGRYRR